MRQVSRNWIRPKHNIRLTADNIVCILNEIAEAISPRLISMLSDTLKEGRQGTLMLEREIIARVGTVLERLKTSTGK